MCGKKTIGCIFLCRAVHHTGLQATRPWTDHLSSSLSCSGWSGLYTSSTPVASLQNTGQQLSKLCRWQHTAQPPCLCVLHNGMYLWSPLQSHNSTSALNGFPVSGSTPLDSNSSIRTPCVGWYSPPELSVASPR